MILNLPSQVVENWQTYLHYNERTFYSIFPYTDTINNVQGPKNDRLPSATETAIAREKLTSYSNSMSKNTLKKFVPIIEILWFILRSKHKVFTNNFSDNKIRLYFN